VSKKAARIKCVKCSCMKPRRSFMYGVKKIYKSRICARCRCDRSAGLYSKNRKAIAANRKRHLANDTLFKCIKCNCDLPASQCPKAANSIDGFKKQCRPCRLAGKKAMGVGARYNNLVHSAKSRNIELRMTLEQYAEIFKGGCCSYCGADLPLRGCGLDRIDNSDCYHPGNVALCCALCNRVKCHLFTQEEMLVLAPALSEIMDARRFRENYAREAELYEQSSGSLL
jgi:hypothetical protein